MTTKAGDASIKLCTVAGCDRRTVARGMCMLHYKRARAGKPLTQLEKGDPSGCGVYGVLDDDGETVMCHECGWRGPRLSQHVPAEHDMTVREYKIRHGLKLTRGLTSAADHARWVALGKERAESPLFERLVAKRDPVSASQARTEESFAAMGRQYDVETLRERARLARPVRVETCAVCGAQWCPLPSRPRRATCSPACQTVHVARVFGARRGARVLSCVICHAQWCSMAGVPPRWTCSRSCANALMKVQRARWQAGETGDYDEIDRMIRRYLIDRVGTRELAGQWGITMSAVGERFRSRGFCGPIRREGPRPGDDIMI